MKRRKFISGALASVALAASPMATGIASAGTDAGKAAGWTSTFTTNHNGWTPVSGYWYMNGGNYACDGDQDYVNSIVHTGTYRNFIYQARLKRDGNGGGYWNNSLIVRGSTYTDSEGWWTPSYLFSFTNTKYFSVWRLNRDGSATTLKDWTYASVIGTQLWKTMKVVAQGGSFTFSLNGRTVWSGRDSMFTSGQVGIGFYTSSPYWSLLRVDSATMQTLAADAKVTPDPAAVLGKTVKGGTPFVAPH